MSSVSGQFSVFLSVLSRLQGFEHLTFPYTYSPTHPSARSLGTRPYLTSSHQTHRAVYLCILIHLPSSLTLTYLIHTRLISFHPFYNNITHCILYPSSSSSSHIFIYAIPKSVAMENSFLFFFFFLFSVLFVSSRLVSSLLVSLFRFILSHAYYLTSFVVPSRNVDLAWTFFFVYTVIYCTYDTLIDWGCRLIECK